MLLEAVPNPGCVAVLCDTGTEMGKQLARREITAAAQTLRTVLKR
jgi:hypothetical protein